MTEVKEVNEPGPEAARPAVNRRWQNSANWRSKASPQTSQPETQDDTGYSPNGAQSRKNNSKSGPTKPYNNNKSIWAHRHNPPNPARSFNRPLENQENVSYSVPEVPASFAEGRRLYVGNMPYMAKREDVQALFKDSTTHGKSERIDISIDPFTGRNPSFCFVELENREQATNAMAELDGKDILGRPVKIKPGVPKSPKPQFGRRDPSGRENKQPRPFVFDRWERDDASNHWYGVADEGRRLFVGGLPRMPNQATADYEIQKLFYGFKIEAISKVISPHPVKRSQPGNHYFLFVDLASAKEADKAIETLRGVSAVWGSPVYINKARGNSQKPAERQRWEEPGDEIEDDTQSKDGRNPASSENWRRSPSPSVDDSELDNGVPLPVRPAKVSS